MSRSRAVFTDLPYGDDEKETLRYEITGAPNGFPVFLMHGTPGSRIGPKPRSSVLYRLGVRLICYDRPGYGGSTRREKRTVASAAEDVQRIADSIGIDEFAVVGRSGGGPHALATAARLGARVTRAAVLVSLAPADAWDLDWYRGMTDANVREYSTADDDQDKLIESLRLQADRARRNPAGLVDVLREQMTDPDLRVVDDVMIRELLAETYAEALRAGPYGWIDDVLAFRAPWEFELSDVKQDVRLWHGDQDNFSPASHTRWLAAQLDKPDVQLQRETAHFGAMEILPATLAWLTKVPVR